MEIFYNDKCKITLISYPKVAGSTLRNLLLEDENLDVKNVKEKVKKTTGFWEVLQTPIDTIVDNNINCLLDKIPNKSDVYILYRDPHARYASGFAYVMQNEYDFFLRSIVQSENSNTVINKQWCEIFVNNVIQLNIGACHLNNIHTARYMHLILMLKDILGSRAKTIHINDLDNFLRLMFDIKSDEPIPHINSVKNNYDLDKTDNQLSVKLSKMLHKFLMQDVFNDMYDPLDQVLSTDWISALKYYLHTEKMIFNHLQNPQMTDREMLQVFANYILEIMPANPYYYRANNVNLDYVQSLGYYAMSEYNTDKELASYINNWLDMQPVRNLYSLPHLNNDSHRGAQAL